MKFLLTVALRRIGDIQPAPSRPTQTSTSSVSKGKAVQVLNLVLATLLLFSFSTGAAGQGVNYDTPEVKSEYDKFKDVTIVSLPPFFVIKPRPKGLQFGMMSGYKGNAPVTPKSILWIFFSPSPTESQTYAISHGVIVLADGERFNLGDTTHKLTYNEGFFIEAMLLDVPFKTLVKISKAKSVEIQIGSTDFAASPQLLMAMREFASRLR
jgi:hypothetical protein